MPATATAPLADASHLRQYRDEGWTVVRGLVPAERAARMRDHFMAKRAEGPKPGDMGGDPSKATDPLNAFPRMIAMEAWDPRTAEWAADAAVVAAASALIGQRAVLTQTMLYFKPPGARGQALHQDQQYITKDPLVGAWCALDRSDRANGCMIVVPRSHRDGLLAVKRDDPNASFSGGAAVVRPDAVEVAVEMEAGDVLFFGGATVHGSYPNTTTDRFRRSFICHYVGEHAKDFAPEQGKHMSHLAP